MGFLLRVFTVGQEYFQFFSSGLGVDVVAASSEVNIRIFGRDLGFDYFPSELMMLGHLVDESGGHVDFGSLWHFEIKILLK